MRIESIADHLDLIPLIGRWHWDKWGHADPQGSLETWTRGLAEKTVRDGVPTTFVALDGGGEAVGSVTLVEHDMPDRPELAEMTPWIAGTFVVAHARGRGVGSALMRHATAEAKRWGISRLYLYTSTAERFYEALGWKTLDHLVYEGEPNAVMTLDL